MKLFRTDLYRSICTPRFWVLTFCFTVAIVFSCMDMIRPTLSGGAETGTVDLLTYMLTMDKFKVLMVILVSAICANSFCEDQNHRYLRAILTRTDLLHYSISRFAANETAVLLSCILAFFLFSGLALAPGFSLSAGSFTDYYYTMAERQPALYTLMMALQFGAVCACCSSFGLLLSAFQPNAFVSTGIGGLTFFCAVSYIPNLSMFSILRIITMNPVLPLGNETPQWLSFLWGMMVPLAVTALCMWGFYRRLEWRQENGRL